jgi:hypothetical protein
MIIIRREVSVKISSLCSLFLIRKVEKLKKIVVNKI